MGAYLRLAGGQCLLHLPARIASVICIYLSALWLSSSCSIFSSFRAGSVASEHQRLSLAAGEAKAGGGQRRYRQRWRKRGGDRGSSGGVATSALLAQRRCKVSGLALLW